MMITTMMAAVAAAAQPVPATSSSQPQAQPMQHEHGQTSKMSSEDCVKCCEEVMASMHAGHDSAASEHKHQ